MSILWTVSLAAYIWQCVWFHRLPLKSGAGEVSHKLEGVNIKCVSWWCRRLLHLMQGQSVCATWPSAVGLWCVQVQINRNIWGDPTVGFCRGSFVDIGLSRAVIFVWRVCWSVWHRLMCNFMYFTLFSGCVDDESVGEADCKSKTGSIRFSGEEEKGDHSVAKLFLRFHSATYKKNVTLLQWGISLKIFVRELKCADLHLFFLCNAILVPAPSLKFYGCAHF